MKNLKSTERLFLLISTLQSSQRRWRADDLASKFGVSRRTIFRDLEKLSQMEIPVTHDPFEGYGIMREYKIPPLMFTTKELATLIVALNFVKSQVDQSLCEDAKRVEDKIRQVLPDRLKSLMETLMDRMLIDPFLHFGVEKKSGGNWYEISSAIASKRKLSFLYTDSDGQTENRKVDPYMLVFYKDHWNLIGYSEERSSIRSFILNRIQNLEILLDSFIPPGKMDVEALVFRNDAPETKVVVDVDYEVERQFKANLPTKIIKETKQTPKYFRCEFLFDNIPLISHWLLQFSDRVRVVSPDSLIGHRRVLLENMMSSIDAKG